MSNPNSWSARDRSREANLGSSLYQDTPLNGYNDGGTSESSQEQGQESPELMKPIGIKSENSQNGVLIGNNPAYQESKQK